MNKRAQRRRLLDRIPAHAIQQVMAMARETKKAFPFSEVLARLWRMKVVVAKQPDTSNGLDF